MLRRLLAVVFASSLARPLPAQQRHISLDASLGAKAGARQATISAWLPLLRVSSRLQVGAGVRGSAFGGDTTNYANRGVVQGGLASSVRIAPATYALNAAVFADLDLVGNLALGANLDLIGMAGGPQRRFGALTAKPQALSYFRYGPADHGTLNSEFFAALRVSRRLRLRGGASHYVTNYVVTDTGAAGPPRSRYQKFETAPFVAARFNW